LNANQALPGKIFGVFRVVEIEFPNRYFGPVNPCGFRHAE
jgi:hypothetical protein